jgi:hypothetical protein
MAKKFRQVVSGDALTIIIEGDRRNPEPGSCIVHFPGGNVEVSRASDGTYWAHIGVVDPGNVVGSRVDHTYEASCELGKIPEFPRADAVKHIALRISNATPHPDHG